MNQPNEPMTAWSISDVTRHCLSLSRSLAEMSEGIEAAELDAVTAKEVATVAEARAVIAATGTVADRRASAIIITTDARLAAEIAEARVRAMKRSVSTLETRISVARSLIANLRQQLQAEGWPR